MEIGDTDRLALSRCIADFTLVFSLKWHYEVFRWLDLYTGKHEDDEQVEV